MSEESNELSSNTTNAATVRFDVGGTVYRVSRSLLTQYPDTMLSRMVSETWLRAQDAGGEGQHPQDNDEPLFIDRNGDRFQYVLDYMRDGQQVSLPTTVSKEGLLKDMEYFGFQNVNIDNIKQNGLTFAQALKKIKEVEKHFTYGTLALYCFVRIMFSGNFSCKIAYDHEDGEFSRSDHQHYNTERKKQELIALARSLRYNIPDWPSFDRCLEPCGLKLARVHVDEYPYCTIHLIPR